LKEKFKNDFKIGASIPGALFMEEQKDQIELLTSQFNLVTPENLMKWDSIQKVEGEYHFEVADRFMDFAEKHNLEVHGHTLIWHAQTPEWVFKNPDGSLPPRKQALKRMEAHIHTVMGRYKGRIAVWDVVNEAFKNEGELRKSVWFEMIGEDYLEHAHRFAREADPNALLCLNDYDTFLPKKCDKLIETATELKKKGLVDAIGLQDHLQLKTPSLEDYERTLAACSATGLKVMITELDVSFKPFKWKYFGNDEEKIEFSPEEIVLLHSYQAEKRVPPELDAEFSQRYADLFHLYRKYSESIYSVGFWCLSDKTSWLNSNPIKDNYPLLFDRELKPKNAYYRIMKEV